MGSRPAGRPLKVGVQLPEVEREVRWPELVELARLGEAIGFDSVWIGDHLLYRSETLGARGPWEAWTTLAGLAAATSRIALGPLVACTSFHNPAMLAKMAATVDEISGGRLHPRPRRGLERDRVPGVRLPVRPAHLPVRGGVHDRPDPPPRGPDRLRRARSTRPATASSCRARPGPAVRRS